MATTGRLDQDLQSSSPELALDGGSRLDGPKRSSSLSHPSYLTLNHYASPHPSPDYEIGIQGEKNGHKTFGSPTNVFL